jgi:hypothetical protein
LSAAAVVADEGVSDRRLAPTKVVTSKFKALSLG